MTPHDHHQFVPGCYRCELSRDEGRDADRTVHGMTVEGYEIVRYDRAGKWYVEGNGYRTHVSVSKAATLATEPGGRVFLGLGGGGRFDFWATGKVEGNSLR
jgi:hypothetical protein